MSRKGGLVSSQDLANMTKIRWMFEHCSLVEKEEGYWERARKLIIALFGLDMFGKTGLLPLEDDELGRFKDVQINDDDLFLPLAMFIHPMMNEKLIGGFFEDREIDKAMADMEFAQLDPESFETELEVLIGDKEFVVEEEAGTFTSPPPGQKVIHIEE